jgi:hypothetical protein
MQYAGGVGGWWWWRHLLTVGPGGVLVLMGISSV